MEGGSDGVMATGNGGATMNDDDENILKKKKVVVVMGATGCGKSRLAVDLGAHFAGVEVVNADSMQVYRGLDILSNKIPTNEQKGVPHHLLGIIDASTEFTVRNFRDLAIPIIDDILSRGGLPVIVGGTNYYIQALVSPYLADDMVEVEEVEACLGLSLGGCDISEDGYERLKEIDPVAANRIHPNDRRKINRYLSLYRMSGVPPSTLFREKSVKKWGHAENFRYDCLFIWVDVSPSVLDNYVNKRVDCMMETGLLHEVYDIYNPSADYTKGLLQAIGVREFEDFFAHFFNREKMSFSSLEGNGGVGNAVAVMYPVTDNASKPIIPNFSKIIDSTDKGLSKLLEEAIDKVKANTRKLLRRQKRRLNRLQTLFAWDLNYIDATKAFLDNTEESWQEVVVEPCVSIVNGFLHQKDSSTSILTMLSDLKSHSAVLRDLWTQYICKACGNQILRGTYEWNQHKQGRAHRRRVQKQKKNIESLALQCRTQPRVLEDDDIAGTTPPVLLPPWFPCSIVTSEG